MAERATGRQSILIIGGGASGVVLAAHLLRDPDADIRITLIEKRNAFGQGVAYSTNLPDHVLNVSAFGMSAYADDPEHFFRWLVGRGLAEPDNPQIYVPRSLYGEYLREILDRLTEQEKGTGRLHTLNEACQSVTTTPSGVEVKLANGTSLVGHIAVLAVGHEEQAPPDHRGAIRPGSSEDTPLPADAPVLVLGTGLSMIDLWLSLENRGHSGKIVALSRRGLLPAIHRRGKPIRLDAADVPLGTDLSYFIRWFRQLVRETEDAGGNWRDVVDGIRPFNQRIWQSWPSGAKRRFIEHTRAWWDIHRHRMPPALHERVSRALAAGDLELLAGKLESVRKDGNGFAATIRPRHKQEAVTLNVARIYDCTGITTDLSTGSNPIVRSLIERGLARPDPLRIGLDVTPGCAIVNAEGAASTRLFAIGPLTRGTFFEIEAIPDIRTQCSALARRLTEKVA
jgi:uncharacterized NAD(P)/FAD-binding protein YdhS